MWNILILLLLQDAISADEFCKEDPVRLCSIRGLPEELIPANTEDFKNACSQYTEYVDCLEKYETTCPDGHIIVFFTPGDSSYGYSLIRELCDSNSQLNIEYSKNVECIHSTINAELENCKNRSKSKAVEYYTFFRVQQEAVDFDTLVRKYAIHPICLLHSFKLSCVMSEITESCGLSAGNVVGDLLHRSNFLFQRCDLKELFRLRTGYLEFLDNSAEANMLKKMLYANETLSEFAE